MIKVKISIGWHKNTKGTPPYGEDLSIFNFTNSKENIFNDKKYYINSKVDNPDYWFVLENTRFNSQENTSIAKDKLYFLNSETRYEPSYFLKPSKELFLKQFDKVYSPNFINMNNVKNAPPYLMWRLRGDPFDDINDALDKVHELTDQIEKTDNIFIIKQHFQLSQQRFVSLMSDQSLSFPYQEV